MSGIKNQQKQKITPELFHLDKGQKMTSKTKQVKFLSRKTSFEILTDYF